MDPKGGREKERAREVCARRFAFVLYIGEILGLPHIHEICVRNFGYRKRKYT